MKQSLASALNTAINAAIPAKVIKISSPKKRKP